MKILIYTNLFPNQIEKTRGVFNLQQFKALSKTCDLRVVSPVAKIPLFSLLQKNTPCNIPDQDKIEGIPSYFPKFKHLPVIARSWMDCSVLNAVESLSEKIMMEFDPEIILGTWAYPDAYAAFQIAKKYQKPFFVKVHGSDINFLDQYPDRMKKVTEMLNASEKVVSVSNGLSQKMIDFGVEPNKIEYIPNGVEHKKFYPMDQQQARKDLGLDLNKKYILFIGNLCPVKGVKYLIQAFESIKTEADLLIVGDGALKKSLQNLSQQLDLEDRVHFLGRRSHEDIPKLINSADLFCLPSLNEGCPNVILESLACGVPVVASHVGGIPDLLTSDEFGILFEPQNPDAISKAIDQAFGKNWSHLKTKAHEVTWSWEETAKRLKNIFEQKKESF